MSHFFPSSAWLLLVLLASAWLLPNHYPPWTAFHAEFLCAMTMVCVGLVVGFKNRYQVASTRLQYLLAILLTQVVLDLALGTVFSSGLTWLCGLYLVGFAFAVRLGTVWQANISGECADFVFGAVVLAAVTSAALQCLQLNGFQTDSQWFNAAPSNFRMDANLAQPNHLASLELLALVGCSWLSLRNKIPRALSMAAAVLIVVGIVLTGSRTAVLTSLMLLAAYPFCLPGHPRRSAHLLAAALLGFCYAALLAAMPALHEFMDAANRGVQLQARSVQGDARIQIWSLAIDAIQQNPWWGYGWGQIASAQMAVASRHGEVAAFNSAHNLWLDLALWGGLPVALLVFVYGCLWLRQQIRSPAGVRQSHTLLFLGVLTIHAMLELPLHYAYFLLPFAVMLGTLEPINIGGATSGLRKIVALAGLTLCACAVVLTGVDYLKIEQAEKLLRLEAVHAKFSTPDIVKVPKLLILNHYEDFFLLSRLLPANGLAKEQLDSMADVVRIVPSERLMYNMAANFALNGYADEARQWMQIECKTKGEIVCGQAAIKWRIQGLERETGLTWFVP
jgi:O-antigen ligase